LYGKVDVPAVSFPNSILNDFQNNPNTPNKQIYGCFMAPFTKSQDLTLSETLTIFPTLFETPK
jgi:hypothetical protein